jgi:hypothetical protein
LLAPTVCAVVAVKDSTVAVSAVVTVVAGIAAVVFIAVVAAAAVVVVVVAVVVVVVVVVIVLTESACDFVGVVATAAEDAARAFLPFIGSSRRCRKRK